MTTAEISGSDLFVVQTLYDGKWRSDKKFILEQHAQNYAALLIPDWGTQRVRLLLGTYDAREDRRTYTELDKVSPKSKYNQMIDTVQSTVQALVQVALKRAGASPIIAGLSAVLILMIVSAVTSFPSLASDEKKQTENRVVAEAQAPIARNIRDVFSDLSSSKYAKAKTLKAVPLRLRGDWSRQCSAGLQDLQIREKTVTEFDGAMANDTELQAVFQTGQTYGLVTKDGKTQILEMTGVDVVKIVGFLTEEGHFFASNVEGLLKRCL